MSDDFTVDEEGRRHYVLRPEAAHLRLTGHVAKLIRRNRFGQILDRLNRVHGGGRLKAEDDPFVISQAKRIISLRHQGKSYKYISGTVGYCREECARLYKKFVGGTHH